MAWNIPKSWSSGEVVTATDLNQQVRDNMLHLIKKPIDFASLSTGGNYAVASSSYINLDATNLSLSVRSETGRVGWFVGLTATAATTMQMGLRINLDNGFAYPVLFNHVLVTAGQNTYFPAFSFWNSFTPGLTHTLTLQIRSTGALTVLREPNHPILFLAWEL